jgi:[acyl-carrier-protein] S-malonyltransferase
MQRQLQFPPNEIKKNLIIQLTAPVNGHNPATKMICYLIYRSRSWESFSGLIGKIDKEAATANA